MMFGINKTKKDMYSGRKRPFIDVETEYGAGPLWLCTDEVDAIKQPVEPASLPLSKELMQDLLAWQHEMDEPLRIPDYDWSRSNHKVSPEFWEKGRQLTDRLKLEIGDKYDIAYSHDSETNSNL